MHRVTVDEQGHVVVRDQRMSCDGIAPGSDCLVVGVGDHYEIYNSLEEWARHIVAEGIETEP